MAMNKAEKAAREQARRDHKDAIENPPTYDETARAQSDEDIVSAAMELREMDTHLQFDWSSPQYVKLCALFKLCDERDEIDRYMRSMP